MERWSLDSSRRDIGLWIIWWFPEQSRLIINYNQRKKSSQFEWERKNQIQSFLSEVFGTQSAKPLPMLVSRTPTFSFIQSKLSLIDKVETFPHGQFRRNVHYEKFAKLQFKLFQKTKQLNINEPESVCYFATTLQTSWTARKCFRNWWFFINLLSYRKTPLKKDSS